MNPGVKGGRGFALPLVLLLLLALTFLAHGVLLLSRRDLQASMTFRQATQAREAARWALRRSLLFSDTLEAIRGTGMNRDLFQDWTGEGIWTKASARWLSPELFLLVGEGGVRGWGGAKRVAGVGWMMDPPTRLGDFRGGLEAKGTVRIEGGAVVSADSLLALPFGWDELDCRDYRPVLDTVFQGASLPLVSGLSPPGKTEEDSIPGLGLLSGEGILGWGKEPGPSLLPGTGQGCPGAGQPLFWTTRGSLTLERGWACGLLVVGGDLILDGSARFQGLALVGGSLELKGASLFQGFARIRGSVRFLETSRLDASACAAFRTLVELRPLRKPILLPWASNIGAF